jgi:hypothetical protein
MVQPHMLVLPDNDVGGIVDVLRRVLDSEEWSEYTQSVGVEFIEFEDLGLTRDASDRQVWETAQSAGAVLITANRAGGQGSLDEVLGAYNDQNSLPVITISDPQRVANDGDYAYRAAVQLLDYLDRIADLKGIGRLFVP